MAEAVDVPDVAEEVVSAEEVSFVVGDTFESYDVLSAKIKAYEQANFIQFWRMLLPCRHMFALRIKLEEPLFDSTVCEKRWTTEHYRSTQRLFSSYSSQPLLAVAQSSSKRNRKLSQHDKYRKALLLTSELASVASGASHIHFHRRLKLLKDLIDHSDWKCGEEVGLVDLDEGV